MNKTNRLIEYLFNKNLMLDMSFLIWIKVLSIKLGFSFQVQ